MKNLIIKFSLFLFIINTFSAILFKEAKADIQFSGDVTGVSAYVWRGIKQFDGVALQGTVATSYKALSFGVWYSSVTFGPGTPFMETDPFIELSLSTGPLSSSIGSTIYSYDFKSFNDQADYEYELFTKIGLGPAGLAFYFVPAQNSTKTDLNDSYYWVEVSTSISTLGVDWGILYEFGTYSGRFLATPIDDPIGEFVISANKSISETIMICWSYSIPTSSELENNLNVSLGYFF